MPRVLHLIDHNGLGGAQQLLAGLLEARGDDLALALRKRRERLLDLEARAPVSGRGAYFPWVLARLPRLVWAQRVEIVHCHLRASWVVGVGLARWLAHQEAPRFVFHEHNPYLVSSPLYRRLLREASRWGRVVAVSAHIYDLVRGAGVSDNSLTLLENFVSPRFFALGDAVVSPHEGASVISGGAWRIGFSGRLDGIKGWQHFLEVARLLRQETFRFVIAGSGPDEAKLRAEIAAEGLEASVQVLGFVADMPGFYRSLNVLLAPSLFESFGLVPLEAQACGVPVVAFDSAGIRERLGPPSALLVPVGDAPAMAAAVRQLRANPELYRELVERGRENASRFSVDKYLARLEALYEALLRSPKEG